MISDGLVVSLTLRMGDDSLTFPAGAVTEFAFQVTRIGFNASLSLTVSSEQEADALFAHFMSSTPMEARLSIEPRESVQDGTERDPLVLDGRVIDKTVHETASESIAGLPVILRRYGIRFEDPAQALWKQHFPTELYADAPLKTLLDAHRPGGLKLTYDWQWLLEERPIIALGLGNPDNQASFYDWVLWLVDRHGGVFEFDTKTNTYRFGSQKTSDTQGAVLAIADVADHNLVLPPIPRAELHVLNSFAPSPQNKTVDLPDVIAGVREDHLLYTPIQGNVDTAVELERVSRRVALPQVHVSFAQYPRSTFRPNKGVTFDDDTSPSLFVAKKPFRVASFSATARPPADPSDVAELDDEAAVYGLEIEALLEQRACPSLTLPEYTPPTYPFHLEGKVVSDGGQQADRTWAVMEDAKNSLLYHTVNVPLFNKKIVVRYEPHFFPGLFFFPAYKNQRVLLSVHFDEAQIARFVDWADNARQPMDSQGQAIAFGKQASAGTTLTHVYTDGKPVLQVQRKNDTDIQTLTISDGNMLLSVAQTSPVPALDQVYDLTPNVAGAKGKLETAVKGSVSEVTGKFGAASGQVQEKLSQTTEEVDAKLTDIETQLSTRSAMVRAEAEGMVSALSDTTAQIATAVADAKAAIRSLLGS